MCTALHNTIGKKAAWFVAKPTNSSSKKVVTPIQKPAPVVATICVQDDEVVLVTKDNRVMLTEDEIGNLFQLFDYILTIRKFEILRYTT